MNIIAKIIKKQRLLKKYKKGNKQWEDQIWLLTNFDWDVKQLHWFSHQFHCELRCYYRLKKI
jgi:hypothetical protein